MPEGCAGLDVVPELEALEAVRDQASVQADGIHSLHAPGRLRRHHEIGAEHVITRQDMVHRLAQHLLDFDERRKVRDFSGFFLRVADLVEGCD